MGAIYADKVYCDRHAQKSASRRGCYLAAIKKNNMKNKYKDKDRCISKIRAPLEIIKS